MLTSELIGELQHQLRTHGDTPVLIKRRTTFIPAVTTIAEKAQPIPGRNSREWELVPPGNPDYKDAHIAICIF